MPDFNDSYKSFKNEIMLEAEQAGELKARAFFNLYFQAALENGDIGDIEYCPVRSSGAKQFQIDGYSYNNEQGELSLVICDHHDGEELETINASHIEILFKKVERLYGKSKNVNFIDSLEETSPTFEIAYIIHSKIKQIKRVRITIFSDAVIRARKQMQLMKDEFGIRFTFNIIDFQRFSDIESSKGDADPIEIDFEEMNGCGLPCLPAFSGSEEYQSYLIVLPGNLLADIYGLFGPRLLEQNVRTFLQAKTKVNKGIITTIEKDPSKFFAFNNGLTATAASVELLGDNQIKSIKNLQIVNGGQTTASILYAKDRRGANLDDVYVQMKLSVVKPELIDEIVPKISKYANTQNRITEADFFSSHPFHLEMEKMSRRLSAPPTEDSLISTKWFYERARGQYKDKQAYLSSSARKKFLTQHPRNQMIVKTDLAKYEMSFKCRPDEVSKGALRCFMIYADDIDKNWSDNGTNFGDSFFKSAMIRAMIFRWTDKMIAASEWYKLDRAFKSQTVTYTIALFSHLLKKETLELDYNKLWSKQSIPLDLQKVLVKIAPKVAKVIKDAPSNMRNVPEFCKRQACWAKVKLELEISIKYEITDWLVSQEDAKEENLKDIKLKKMDVGIEAQIQVANIPVNDWKEIGKICIESKLLNSTELGIITWVLQRPNSTPSEKQSKILVGVFKKLKDNGFHVL